MWVSKNKSPDVSGIGVLHRVLAVTLWIVVPGCAAEELCYSSGGIAGIVIATFIVTLVLGGVVLAMGWFIWKKKYGGRIIREKPDTKQEKTDGKGKYAFDNPYFRNDENDGTTLDSAEKGKATLTPDYPVASSGKHIKVAPPPKHKKNRLMLTKPFTSVFHPHKKHRTMDDNDLSMEPEIVLVPLRGHDFTGLGFNIFGNMRDGIFVKDVLHRGPASESGRIKAGDRILNVTVSFTNMVYEDALTILSYASPYDVQLELEKTSENDQGIAAPSAGKRLGSSSFSDGGQRLFHPLYRSQSIDDLTQIDKDSFPSKGLAPKRSQSIGLAAQRLRSHLEGRNKEVAPEEIDRLTTNINGSMNEHMLATAMVDDGNHKKLLYRERNADFALTINEKLLVKNETEEVGCSENFTNISEEKQSLSTNVPLEESCARPDEKFVIKEKEQNTEANDTNEEKTLSLPRKMATPGKRRAPAPPQSFHGVAMETKAFVHQFEDSEENKIRCNHDDEKCSSSTETTEDRKNSIESSKPLTNGVSDSVEVDSLENFYMYEETYVGEDEDSDVSKDSLETDDKGEKVRRRSSSLGDIKKLEEAVNRSPTLLERAVSLDFQKLTLPEGNLREQNKILGPTNYNPQEEEVFIPLKEVKEPIKHLNISKISPYVVEAKPQEEINNSFTLYHNENVSSPDDTMKKHAIEPDVSLNLDYLSNTSTISKSSSISSVSSQSNHEEKNMTSTPAKRVIKIDNNLLKSNLCFDTKNSKEGYIPAQRENKLDFTFKTSNNASPAQVSRKDNSPLTVDIPIIPPVIRHQEKTASSHLILTPASRPENKDVNEISKQKLDSMFFSHKDSLLEQVTTKDTHPSPNPELTTKWPSESTDFDSWSFEVGPGSTVKSYMSSMNGNSSEISSNLYKTAVEIPLDNSGNVMEHSRKELAPEMSSYTVRSAEGGITQTVIISTNNSSTAHSPPPQLQPPSY
ncbi:uncharacterized protein LOC106466407 [Limulus polyphemus]|uniref:Uncharacterized protein LOC106466407 n=1 Tax=Limulus polyphemus TaxID=6850 RepID=A0ABM1T2K9_LIMPO|nr:uncharacterized protein LOC106466407 [Limulus polyphemus]